MDSSTVEEQPASTPVSTKPQARDRERGERKKKGGNSRDSDSFDQNGPKPGSMSNDNLDSLLHLKRALIKHDQSQVPGYLSVEEVRSACAKHCAKYHINLPPGRIQTAISQARSIDPTTGLINVGLFCRFLDNE